MPTSNQSDFDSRLDPPDCRDDVDDWCDTCGEPRDECLRLGQCEEARNIRADRYNERHD